MTEQTQAQNTEVQKGNGLPEGILHPTEIKNASFDEKLAWLKAVLTNTEVDNLDVATNIINFIRGGKKFSDDFFAHPIVIASSTQEFIDLKRKCKPEIQAFCAKLLGIYLSCIKNCGNIVEADGPVPVPHCYLNVLLGLDFITLSKIQQDLSLKQISYAEDGKIYIESIAILAAYAKTLNILEEIIDIEAVKAEEDKEQREATKENGQR
jgi:hypothetical protein